MVMRVAARKPLMGESVNFIVEEDGKVTHKGKSVKLTQAMAKLFIFMADRKPRTCTLEQMAVVYKMQGSQAEPDPAGAKVHVSRIRAALKTLTDIEVIETVRGVGYRIPGYVEVHTTLVDGELFRLKSDMLPALTDLAYGAQLSMQEAFERVVIEGLRACRRKYIDKNLMGEGDELLDDLDLDETEGDDQDPWE